MDIDICGKPEMSHQKLGIAVAIRLLETGDADDLRVAINNLKEIFYDMA